MASELTEAAKRRIKPLEWTTRPQDWLETEEDFKEFAHTQYDAYCPFGNFNINEYRDHVTWNVSFDDRNTSSFDAESVDAAKQAAFDFWCGCIVPCLADPSSSPLIDQIALEQRILAARRTARGLRDNLQHQPTDLADRFDAAADMLERCAMELDRLRMVAGGEE